MPAHAHPCNFRLHRVTDRGWGELAFEYRWDSTSGMKEEGISNPDLAACFLYEITTYADNEGSWKAGCLFPPDPPFVGWKFRDPTDGRSAPVGLERFSALQGWAWDRHKMPGRLAIPPLVKPYTIHAVQQFFFHCERCGLEGPVPGSHTGPHTILRTFTPCIPSENAVVTWRYTVEKHSRSAWLELNRNGYFADSADIGFGPDWL